MNDEELIRALKEMKEKKVIKPSSFLNICEFSKRTAEQDDDLKEMVKFLDVKVQIAHLDSGYKYWVKMDKDGIDYGEGVIERPNYILTFIEGWVDALVEFVVASRIKTVDIKGERGAYKLVKFTEILNLIFEKLPFKLKMGDAELFKYLNLNEFQILQLLAMTSDSYDQDEELESLKEETELPVKEVKVDSAKESLYRWTYLSYSSILNLMKRVKNVPYSRGAVELLRSHLEKTVSHLINQANAFALHAGHKKMLKEDIEKAIKYK
ncbi:MAG: hypothetical protein ACFE8J_17555 [Candidatus Heimdallarchaeota archaeon]